MVFCGKHRVENQQRLVEEFYEELQWQMCAYFGEIGHLSGLKTAGCPGQIGHPHLNERRWTKIPV